MKLVTVVISTKTQTMSVLVEDPNGKHRRISLVWHSKEPVLLPADWMGLVEAEVNYQLAEELAKASGRRLIP